MARVAAKAKRCHGNMSLGWWDWEARMAMPAWISKEVVREDDTRQCGHMQMGQGSDYVQLKCGHVQTS